MHVYMYVDHGSEGLFLSCQHSEQVHVHSRGLGVLPKRYTPLRLQFPGFPDVTCSLASKSAVSVSASAKHCSVLN